MPEVGVLKRAGAALHTFARGYPEAHEDFPWGELAMKVRGKVFLFMRSEAGSLSLSVKLPHSHGAALMLPFAEPTGYGLWKSGWVTARFVGNARPPLRLLEQWIDESYRAVAPRRLSAALASKEAPAPAERPKRAVRRRNTRS